MVSKDVTRLGTVLNTSKELLTLDALKISVLVLTDVSRPRRQSFIITTSPESLLSEWRWQEQKKDLISWKTS
ncbi:unnamed protein product [Acanthoscelides obtectus]|uniref:Uncharacterized protein n=1 Tax=Acanthoscelides obtectus TaxID=200917 RepID=A0A9P0PQE1_ACAOB|nr:unnamed protein product [Acanthoscelides obtectus]CAK1676990.1 hypothetical protein AOBTE_LOCUS31050 [Acanthoscelides obtectus]